MSLPAVTVCVPAWNAAAFVDRTLASIAAQTHPDFRVLISVDRSDDDTAGACRAWQRDSRFSVVEQDGRLGWIGNVNWLLERVETPHLCLVLHDDWIEPDYLEQLAARLEAEQDAVIAYGDVHGYGNRTQVLIHMSLVGTAFDRIMHFLLNRIMALEWRGVMRTDAVRRTRLMRHDANGCAADTLWLLELAALGEFVREPGVVYHKWFRNDSVSGRWNVRPPEQASAEWTDHAIACCRAALAAGEWTLDERRQIMAAGISRAVRQSWLETEIPPSTAAHHLRVAHVAMRLVGEIPEGAFLASERPDDIHPRLRDWNWQSLIVSRLPTAGLPPLEEEGGRSRPAGR